MKINWFSPIPPAKTAIAQYSRSLFQHLSNVATVTVWVSQNEWETSITKFVRVRQFSNDLWVELNEADINIYHIGNHVEFHSWIWEISLQYPGIVVLHDQDLRHLFSGYYLGYKGDRSGYEKAIRKYYGNFSSYNEVLRESYPLTLHAIENALGVVVHTQQELKTIINHKLTPVVLQNLPYADTHQFYRKRTSETRRKAPYGIIIFGYLGPNRGIEIVLQVLSKFCSSNQFRLDIFGTLWSKPSIEKLIRDLQLSSIVHLHGYVTERELEEALEEADLCINLRYPSMGEASYSQMQIWSHALPSIVTQVGWYATLPEETVFFVRPQHEEQDLMQLLESFLSQPDIFYKKGENGYFHLQKDHSCEAYVRNILEFIPIAKQHRSSVAGIKLVERINDMLTSYDLNTQQKVVQKIYEMAV